MNYLVEEVWINELPPIVKTSGGSMNKWITSNGISSGGRHIGIIFHWKLTSFSNFNKAMSSSHPLVLM